MPTSYNPYQAPKTDFTEVQPAPDEVELATILQRILARVIDSLILGVAQFFIVVILILVVFFGGGFHEQNLENLFSTRADDLALITFNLFDPIIWGSIIVTHALFLALHGVLLHRYGQTIGKRLLKIAMVDADTHEIVPLPRLFVLRYLIWDIPALFFNLINWIIRIIDLCFAFRENRRTLHDMTANTIVIKVDTHSTTTRRP